ncbi:hypothetical protein HK102_005899 [Quaeritorhiza haematococci]|nr:hypothetical protein HK102_005899 [Quaeritorhiza haematococci]
MAAAATPREDVPPGIAHPESNLRRWYRGTVWILSAAMPVLAIGKAFIVGVPLSRPMVDNSLVRAVIRNHWAVATILIGLQNLLAQGHEMVAGLQPNSFFVDTLLFMTAVANTASKIYLTKWNIKVCKDDIHTYAFIYRLMILEYFGYV